MANAIASISGVRYVDGIGVQILLDTYIYGADVSKGSVSCPCEVTVLPEDTAGVLITKASQTIVDDAMTNHGLVVDIKDIILPSLTKGG